MAFKSQPFFKAYFSQKDFTMLLDDEKQHEGLANKRKTPTIISSGNFLRFAVKAMAIYFVDLPNLPSGNLT